jgi:hypothetical protein
VNFAKLISTPKLIFVFSTASSQVLNYRICPQHLTFHCLYVARKSTDNYQVTKLSMDNISADNPKHENQRMATVLISTVQLAKSM